MELAKKHQDQLDRIKTSVRRSYDYFKPNYDRYNEFRQFVFESSLSADDISLLDSLSKPALEFNVLEAYISRLLGEFSKQEPSIAVGADDQNAANPAVIKLVEQHIRHILCDSQNHHTAYEVYKDLLSGGFSTFKVTTDYANPMSFDQVIKWERAYDPTLCGFDPLARETHKGDGRFCFELFPMEKEAFEEKYPDIDVTRLDFTRKFEGFNWTYINDKTPIILVCDYYEKKTKKLKIVKLNNDKVLSVKKYEEMIAQWTDITQPPVPVGKPRMTEIETICRYRVIENKVLEYVETDFNIFPLIFVDGNSVTIKKNKNGNVQQVTRPYVYHAKSAQKLKNFAGSSLANEVENIVQHKFMVAKEAIPTEPDYLEAYKDVQTASVLVYNQYSDLDPDKPIPNPIREVQRAPAPPEIMQAFSSTDGLMQVILGSYDASLGINDNQLSGVAIVEGATQSNSAAMPFIVGYLQGLQRVAQIIVDLIPKYYKTPRTIPIMNEEGHKDSVKINQQNGIDMFYDENALNVKVEAGVNFRVQQSRALQQIIALMQASPLFAQFINEAGLPQLLDNVEIRGIDEMKDSAKKWMIQLQQQKQMQMKQQQEAMQNNPMMLKVQNERMKIQQDGQKSQAQFMLDAEQLKLDAEKMLERAQTEKDKAAVQIIKADTERMVHQIDSKLKHEDMQHRHAKEAVELHHMINQPKETNHANT
jgi:hypothetical protein